MIGTRTVGAGLAVIGAMLLAESPPVGVFSALSAPSNGTAETVKIAPASPVQGDTIVVVVTPEASSAGNVLVTVRFDIAPVPLTTRSSAREEHAGLALRGDTGRLPERCADAPRKRRDPVELSLGCSPEQQRP